MTNKTFPLSVLRNKKNNLEEAKQDLSLLNTQAQHYLHAATSYNTRKAYQADVRHFIAWGGLLPTTPDVLIHYLTNQAPRLNARTLTRRLTALKHWHVYQGFTDPTAHPTVRKTLTGIKQVHGQPKDKALPFTVETLSTLTTYLQNKDQLIHWRNNALLQMGFFGAFRRSELANIQLEQIRFVPEGMEILIPRSKTDQAGEGQTCAIPYGNQALCAVTAVKAWLEKSQLAEGALFRRLTKKGTITKDALQASHINRIIQSLVQVCQLPEAEKYSSHSLRRGFATTASQKGAPFGAIMRQGRWRHEGTVLGYIEEGKRFEANAVNYILGQQNMID